MGTDCDIHADVNGPYSPAVGADGTIYFGSGDRNIWAVTDGGMTRWRYTTPMPVVASAHCTDDAVYIGDRNGTLYKVLFCFHNPVLLTFDIVHLIPIVNRYLSYTKARLG